MNSKLLLTAAIIAFSLPLRAQLVNTPTEDDTGSNGGSTISASTNLLSSSGGATFTESNFNSLFGQSSVAVLNDGSLGSNGGAIADTAVPAQVNADGSPTVPFTVTYNLGSNPLGYTVNNIKVISGWTADFVNQNFSVAYSTVADPSLFLSLGSYTLDTAEPFQGGLYITLQSSLSTGTVLPIADGVADLQFTFNAEPSPQGTGGSGKSPTTVTRRSTATSQDRQGPPTQIPAQPVRAAIPHGTHDQETPAPRARPARHNRALVHSRTYR